MEGKSCFFIGHREASEKLLPALLEAIETHITEYGVREFIVGHYGEFDRLAAIAVKKAKQQHPEITLLMLLPYHPAERPFESIALNPALLHTFFRSCMKKILASSRKTWFNIF